MSPEALPESWPQAGSGPEARLARPVVLREVAQWFFPVHALAATLAALLTWASPTEIGGGPPVAVAWGVVGLLALVSGRLPQRWLVSGMAAVLALACTAIALSAWLGSGLGSPAIGALGVLVCVACAVAGRRGGMAVTALATLIVSALHGALAATIDPLTLGLRLGAHLLAIGVGLASGLMISGVIERYLRSATEREKRFRSLLALAADRYWEIDAQYRIAAVSDQHDEGERSTQPTPSKRARGLGSVPWEQPDFGCEPEVLDQLLADLDARLPFRDVPVRWSGRSGRVGHYLVSGEPRFDERGAFRGYWGVARDVSDEQAAREALADTETRYRELFNRIPTPLLLHRGGRIIEANPAAEQLFGRGEEDDLIGLDLYGFFDGGDSRERAHERLVQLQDQPVGTALPVTDFRLHAGERALAVRATGVVVEALGGPAVLSIFIDDTERLLAEEKVRRSEALLSHLVATSPDLITLTELESGRYAMVNQAFERVLGWSPQEATGRTPIELGIWPDEQERQRFVESLRAEGRLSDQPLRFVAKDGTEVALRVSAARFRMDRREYVVVNARDVSASERARLEREAILDNASVGIALTRGQRFVLANREFEAMLGWAPGELVGQSGRAVWPSDSEYRRIGEQWGPALGRGERAEFEGRLARRDGTGFLASVRAHAVDPDRPAEGGTVWIVEDITERRAAELALARARDAAEAANRAKSAFLANTSHELRTPLNGMIGLAHLAREPGLDEAVRRRYLSQIAESAQSLAAIISDILDLSKIEAGKLEIETTTFDLGDLVETLRQSWTPQAAARGLVLHVETGIGVAGVVRGDPLRVRQIANNFLANAIKFTARGEVVLRLTRPAGGDELRIEVQDSGPGIEPDALTRLFKPFTQADESTTRRFGGSGLGLSICRELAALMGGEVGAESSIGVGSLFWARIPLPETDAPPPVVGDGAEQPLTGLRVLLVEDNPVNMMIAAAMLERWGVVVVQATDGQSAVSAVARAAAEGVPFDLVLMDVQMPLMSGYEATRALRAAGQRLPIIALTAAALVTEREQALAAGMDDFLTKPIDVEKLHATLLRWQRPRVEPE